MSESLLDVEEKPSGETGGGENGSPVRYSINQGQHKRTLSAFADITAAVHEEVKKSKMDGKFIDDDLMMDEGDDDLDDDIPSSPTAPAPNFANSPVALRVFSRVQGAKKISIKNFRKRGNSDNNEATEWKSLEDAISAIHAHQSVRHSLEELYKMVTNVCTNEKGGDMYDKLLSLSRFHLTNDLNTKLIATKEVSTVDFLRLVDKLWTDFCEQTLMIRNVFLFLDRTYILNRPEIMSIWDSSLNIFCDIIVNNPYVRERLIKDILSQITDERQGLQINRPLIRSLLRMLTNLHIYEQIFEGAFLESTRELYHTEGVYLSRDLEISPYIHHIKRRLDEEYIRVEVYLDVSTKKSLISVVEDTLIAAHMKAFVSRGLDSLMEGDKYDDLELLFTLLDRVADGLNLLKGHFTDYIKKHGKTIVMDTARDKEMVPDLIKFKNKVDIITMRCFGNHERMVQSLKDSFDYCINTRPNKPAELIAKYIDMRLKAGNKESSDEELDQIMDKLITLFRFIHGKDVFEAFYKKDLAKRLLLCRSASVDAEKAMLCKLKQECGAGFTQKLEGMFKDMEISKELGIAFKKHLDSELKDNDEIPRNAEFTISTLTTGQWPMYEYAEATLPKDLCLYLNAYQTYYVGRHNGRKLQWQHSLGHCLVRGTFRKNACKELQVSLFQTMILLLFNDRSKWTLEELEEATRIEKKELSRTLQSLACAKIKILSKTPKGRDVEKGDSFEVNDQLNVSLYRIKISQVQLKETEEEHAATEEQVNHDRFYAIDAAIVRVMKTRKTLSHAQLIQELFGQLRFPVNSADLKTRIASLMEREFISRDANDPNTYNYVA